MQDFAAEKFAAVLAAHAVRTQRATTPLAQYIKQAAHGKQSLDVGALAKNPLVYMPLLGTAAGGLGGYYGTGDRDDKKKRRNALYGALTGGLGALGGALLYASNKGIKDQNAAIAAPEKAKTPASPAAAVKADNADPASAKTSPADASAAAGDGQAPPQSAADPGHSISKPAEGVGRVAGATAGAFFPGTGYAANAAQRMVESPLDIRRLEAAGGGKKNSLGEAMANLDAELRVRGNRANGLLPRPGQFMDATATGGDWLSRYVNQPGIPADTRRHLKDFLAARQAAQAPGAPKMRVSADQQAAVNQARAAWNNARQTLATREQIVTRLLRPTVADRLGVGRRGLGVTDATRRQRAEALAEALTAVSSKPVNRRDVIKAIQNAAQNNVTWRGRLARGAARTPTGLLGGTLMNPYMMERMLNMADRAWNGAPPPVAE